MHISAKITGIKYKPFLCKDLQVYDFKNLDDAITENGSFLLKTNTEGQIAVSWWVSAKRTRSYPYARVYDTIRFSGKKVTIIPIYKDEGKDGDRDFLQWDTISLMSLLGIYVIIAYYENATKNKDYENKITEQRFNYAYLKNRIKEILSYQSDALHWNLSQIDKVSEIAEKSLQSYQIISKKLKVVMHSNESALKRIQELQKGKDIFMKLSRNLAKKAQLRESVTIQPKEKLNGTKGIITIKNYLGGEYYFTSDEIKNDGKSLYLIEGKHSEKDKLPSTEDIKDGLLKMILFCNLKNVEIDNQFFETTPILKLTTAKNFNVKLLTTSQEKTINLLRQEST
ncbi:MAG: hypothetical protein AB1349_07730 [Elusimicrobiota bacterium]